MALTRDSTITVIEEIRRDPALAKLVFDDALTLFLNGETDTARILMRDLVNGTIGFEPLALATGKPAKSLHRMLSAKGNPSMDNLAAIVGALRKQLGVKLTTRGVKVNETREATRPTKAGPKLRRKISKKRVA